MKTIVLTGGGTAGHVIPNLTLLPKLQEGGWTAVYIGSVKGIEKDIVGDKMPYHAISTGKLRRYFDLQNFFDVFRIIRGIIQAWFLIGKLKPDITFSKGGFVSFPVVVGSWLRGVPVVLHEADITPGLANKLCLPFVKKVCISFPETGKYLASEKSCFTGLPVREELRKGDRSRGLTSCGFSEDKPVILVMGGSLGAQAVNENIRQALPALLEQFQVIHICGKGKVDESYAHLEPDGYRQISYADQELSDLFAASDMVVSRAGANSIYELLYLNLPNILIPLSRKVSRGDQILNAESFRKQGFSRVIEEEELTRDRLINTIEEVYKDRDTYRKTMENHSKKDSAAEILAIIEQIAR